jgi:hypothetical protein
MTPLSDTDMSFLYNMVGTLGKLNAFRRHSDWKRCLHDVVDKNKDLAIMVDGKKAIPHQNVEALVELADQEFIERIICADRGYIDGH